MRIGVVSGERLERFHRGVTHVIVRIGCQLVERDAILQHACRARHVIRTCQISCDDARAMNGAARSGATRASATSACARAVPFARL